MADDEDVPVGEVVAICLIILLAVEAQVAGGVYRVLMRPVPGDLRILNGLALGSAVWAWLYSWAGRRRISLPLDAGWFTVAVWWVVAPYYLLKVLGHRGWLGIAAFVALWVLAGIIGSVIGGVAGG